MPGELQRYDPKDLRYYDVPIEGLGSDFFLPLVRTPDDALWWPVDACCEVIGLRPHGQLPKLRGSEKLAEKLNAFDIKTTTGIRPATFLAYDGLGAWFLEINTNRITRPEVRERVQWFQAKALRLANEVLLGRYAALTLEQMRPLGSAARSGPTARDAYALAEFAEQRVEDLERRFFSEHAYVNEQDEEAIINLPFVAPHAGRYVVRVRLYQRPEIIDVREEP
jgi:hypothetical protein